MIKTIDTNEITEQMFQAFRLGDDLSGKIFNLLKAAPEVKTQPIGTLILGGIVGNEYDEIDIDFKSKALEALQEELVSSENPVVLKVYAHPPAASDLAERIRALQPPKGASFEYRDGFDDCIHAAIELIEGAK